MTTIISRWIFLLMLVALAAGAGCKKGSNTPPPPPAAAKAPPKPAVAVQKPVSSASAQQGRIDFTTKKDLFKPVVAGPPKPVVPVAGSREGILPILAYDVTQFKLIGIVAGLKENRAMAVDPAGKPYVLKEGMHIGKNNGTITKITAASVEVTEQFREENGKIKTHVVRLVLPRKS